MDLIVFLQDRQAKGEFLEGNSLESQMLAYRLEVLIEFLKAGINIDKLTKLKNLLERGRYSLTDSSHMRNYLPQVLDLFVSQVTAILPPGALLSMGFDGTSHGAELFTMSIRFWKKVKFLERLLRFRILDLPMDAALTCACLKGALRRANISFPFVIGAIHDSASVNPAAVAKIKESDTINVVDLPCHPHIIARIGKRLKCDRAVKFIHSICTVFHKSGKIALEWKSYQPLDANNIGGGYWAVPTLSNIRWYNEHEVDVLLMEKITFRRMCSFISNGMSSMGDVDLDDDAWMADLKKTHAALVGLVKPGRRIEAEFQKLELELTVFLHYGRPLARWCYRLEEDSPTLPYVCAAYREIEGLLAEGSLSFTF